MKNNASFVYSFGLILGDAGALLAAFVAAFVLRGALDVRPVAHPVQSTTYIGILVVLMPFWMIIFSLLGLYNSTIYEKRFSEIGRLFMGSFVGMIFVIACDFFLEQVIFPSKLVPIYGFGLAFLFLVLFRNLARTIRILLFSFNMGITNVLIIGETAVAEELVESLRNSKRSGYRVVGLVSAKRQPKGPRPAAKIFRNFDDAVTIVGSDNIHVIIQTDLYSNTYTNNQILNYAQEHHIAFRFVPGNTEMFMGNIQVELFRASIPVIAVHQTALVGWGRIVKRLFDILLTLVILLPLTPLLLLIALIVKVSDIKAPIFFRQTRLTRFNHQFLVYKFRTVKSAYNGLSPEQAFKKMGKPELIQAYRQGGNQIPHDPRYGRLAMLLRLTSLDELPQLFNVLKGDLSLVGPRALVPEELSAYDKKHTILSVKSGLTGLAQVSGRNNISVEERRRLDMYYVQNWSFWWDIIILLKTFRVVITRSN